ncbi:DUF1543 domain-containing protein [Sphingomonas glacialis]|uniref:DUF1543 domain-containing protein n=1 Tax=Sphingomonas glacialis TaxID=658225 RepID=A0A502FS09_9SPHN|nr:DUF1543 domain-containing protein [Sphingomonas glacialis]TPG52245.1 DUF1543 domain-containing protein [Sphingomonas glacialis]
MKLFAIYIGGEHPAAHIEIHDVRFVVAASLHETHAQLRAQWWGTPGTLHIDCWAEIDHADGYDVTLRPEPRAGRERLFFVNLGGYDGEDFAEKHKNMFVVANTVAEAKSRALETISDWKDAHRDDFYEAEQAFALDTKIGDRLHIHLTPSEQARPPRFTCRYTPLK